MLVFLGAILLVDGTYFLVRMESYSTIALLRWLNTQSRFLVNFTYLSFISFLAVSFSEVRMSLLGGDRNNFCFELVLVLELQIVKFVVPTLHKSIMLPDASLSRDEWNEERIFLHSTINSMSLSISIVSNIVEFICFKISF